MLTIPDVDVSQVTFKCSRTRQKWLKSAFETPRAPVRNAFCAPFFFRWLPQSHWHCMREWFAGDISVLANCKSLTTLDAFKCSGVTGKHIPCTLFNLLDQSTLTIPDVDVPQVTFKCLRTRLRWRLSTFETPRAPVRYAFATLFFRCLPQSHWHCMCEVLLEFVTLRCVHVNSLCFRITFTFRRQVHAHDVWCRCSAGDIQVLQNTPSMTFINLRNTTCTGKKCFLRPSFVDYLKATDIARANDLQATFRCWPIASR